MTPAMGAFMKGRIGQSLRHNAADLLGNVCREKEHNDCMISYVVQFLHNDNVTSNKGPSRLAAQAASTGGPANEHDKLSPSPVSSVS